MPLTPKGKKILESMEDTYKSKDKAERVFYASINSGKIEGAEDEADDIQKRAQRVSSKK